MANNEILPFAGTDTGTNLLTQAEYNDDAQRPIGNQPGVARSKLANKVLRQTSLIASAIAQYFANRQSNDITDSLSVATLASYILDAIGGDTQKNSFNSAVAEGTANAITASYTPAVAALTNGMSLFVRATAANTSTTPTFTPNSGVVAAKAIVKGNNLALAVGDIAGAGHWIELQYDTTLDKWVMLNPATGISQGAGGSDFQNQTYTAFTTGGASGTFTLTPSPSITTYSANQRFRVKFHAAGNGTDTINVSGLGAKSIKQYDSTGAKVAPVIAINQLVDLEYDGTHFVILDPLPTSFATNAEAQAFSLASKIISPATLAAAFQGANQSKATNGYQKLPGGLILQWVAAATVTSQTISWQIAFPNACLAVFPGTVHPTASYVWTLQVQSFSATQVAAYSYNNVGGFIFSIGH